MTEDIVGQWKVYFEDPLNPIGTSSIEEAEPGVKGDNSSISRGHVNEAIKQLLSGRALGVDEGHPEIMKTLDVVGLSWLT